DGEAALEGGDTGNLPSTKDALGKRIGNVMQAGNLVDISDYQALACIVSGITHVQGRNQDVASAEAEAAVFKSRAIINGVTPGIAGQELQAMGHALGKVELKRVVIRGAVSELRSDAAKAITVSRRTLSRVCSQNCVRREEY